MNDVFIKDLKEFRGNRTQKEYAEMLNIGVRTVQNWEHRGCSTTIHNILLQLHLAEKKIEQLERRIK